MQGWKTRRKGDIMQAVSRRNVLAVGVAAAAGLAGTSAHAQEKGSAVADSLMGPDELEFDFEFNGVKTAAVEVERDGLVLKGRLEAPACVPEQKVPLVILMHGARGNSRCDLYDNICLAMAARGYAMLRFDFDGHGESDGEFDDSTVLTELEDMKAILAYANGLEWVSGVYALGHSQGGCVGTMFAGENPDAFKAVAVVDPAVNIQDNCASGALDGKASEAYVEAGKTLDIFGTAAGYAGPVCVIHGLDDAVVLPEWGKRLAEAYEQPAELHLLAGAQHTPATHSGVIVDIIDAFFRRTF